MTLIVAWILFPAILAVLCAGIGALIERMSRVELPGPLLLSIGLAGMIVVTQACTYFDPTAELATPLVVVLAVVGIVVARERLRALRPDWWALAAAGVPLVASLARTDTERMAMRLLFARTEYARPFFLPPDLPAERVEALRRAFDATMKDPAFLAEAAKLQLEVSPMTGEAMQALVGELNRTPTAITSRVRAALEAPPK